MQEKENLLSLSIQMNKLIQSLKEEAGFYRLFSSFKDKYKSYGRIEKNITAEINRPTYEEKSAIGGLLGEDLSKKRVIRITADKFMKELNETPYKKVLGTTTLVEIVEWYFGDELVTKKEEQLSFLDKRQEFFDSFKTSEHPDDLKRIIGWVEENANNRLYQQYNQDSSMLDNNLRVASQLLKMFPLDKPIYLPMFAANVTKNPHAFDKNEEQGKFLIFILQVLSNLNEGFSIKKLNAEEIAELFLRYNILVDDLANYVTVFNIYGINKSGEVNGLLKATTEQKSSLNLPLREVIKLKEIIAHNNTIYMVENSNLASYLMSESVSDNSQVSIVCGNGILNLATIKFLEVFVNGGGTVFYAGDFDPEGLGIAQRLINRLGGGVKLWCYDLQNYLKSLSSVEIDNGRLNKLNNTIENKELLGIANEMKIRKLAGYQENMINVILNHLK